MKNIIHLSDIHASTVPARGASSTSLQAVCDSLVEDLKQFPSVDTLFITGDVAYSGVSEEYDVFKECFLNPFLESIGVGLDRVFVVPGNHDLNRKAWGATDEFAREHVITKPEGAARFFAERVECKGGSWFEAFNRFRCYVDDVPGKKVLISNGVYSAYEVDGVAVGALNSAWMAHGDDLNKLFICDAQLSEVLRVMRSFKQRILLQHHPLDWLHQADRGLITDQIHSRGVQALFYGHMHNFGMSKEAQFSEDSVLKAQAGKLEIGKSNESTGYTYLELDEPNCLDGGVLHFRKYSLDSKRFVPWTERVATGKSAYTLRGVTPFSSEDFATACGGLAAFYETDLLCNVGLPIQQQRRLSDIFVLPALVRESRPDSDKALKDGGKAGAAKGKALETARKSIPPFTLESLLASHDSLVVYGAENSGKSTLARRMVLSYLREQESKNFSRVVFYLECNGTSLTKTRKIRERLLGFYEEHGDSKTYSEKLEKWLLASNAVIVIDGIERLDQPGLKAIVDFINEHKEARFLIFGQLAARPTFNELLTKSGAVSRVRTLNVQSLKRSHVRELFGKWSSGGDVAINRNNLIKSAFQTVAGAGMPNNPFVYTMLLSIRERKDVPHAPYMHEADLVENFIEILLQKHVFTAANAPQYKDILLFLGFLAAKCHELSEFVLPENEVTKAVVDFNHKIAQGFSFDGYISPILVSGIMKRDDSGYRFSQVCFYNFVYANWICKNSVAYEALGAHLDFLRFDKVIEYVAAIKKSDVALLEYMHSRSVAAWSELIGESAIEGLQDFENEISRAVSHDVLDKITPGTLDQPLVEEKRTEAEIDEKLDEALPLRSDPVCEVRQRRDSVPSSVAFYETLSLYARVFRAAEHILDAPTTKRHFAQILDLYLNSVAFNVRVFDTRNRPAVITQALERVEYENLNESEQKLFLDQLNAFLNWVIALLPNITVAMMTSDFLNQRQKQRIENYRSETDGNFRKILLTYCLVELDGVDIVAELKAQKYLQPHECLSVFVKGIELILFNFSITDKEKDSLDAFVRKVLSDRKTKRMVESANAISLKMASKGGDLPDSEQFN